jgi:hypothetical protein
LSGSLHSLRPLRRYMQYLRATYAQKAVPCSLDHWLGSLAARTLAERFRRRPSSGSDAAMTAQKADPSPEGFACGPSASHAHLEGDKGFAHACKTLKARPFPVQGFACGLPLRSRRKTAQTRPFPALRVSPAGSRFAHARKAAQIVKELLPESYALQLPGSPRGRYRPIKIRGQQFQAHNKCSKVFLSRFKK